MDKKEIISWFDNEAKDNRLVAIPEEIFAEIDIKLANKIADKHKSKVLIKLPTYEIEFFEWLKESDNIIWLDLWENSKEEEYFVGCSFLPVLIENEERGFPICDLLNNDNYYFSMQHMVDEESKAMIESVTNRFRNGEKLTIEHLLVLEISLGPIDLWHFCYKYKQDIKRVKSAVENLVEDNVLVHLKKAEYLAPLIDF